MSGKLTYEELERKTRQLEQRVQELEQAAAASKHTEQALAASELKFSMAFYNSPYAITITRASDGFFLDVNHAFCTITGYTREEALRDSSVALRLWARAQDRAQLIADVTRGEVVIGRQYQFRSKSEELIDGMFYAQKLIVNGETCVISSINDITGIKRAEAEREKLRAQLHQAQKMESVGRLAGGVAHDYNNISSIIMGYSELALERLDPKDSLFEDLLEINKAARRSADITRQLLAFARQQTIAPKMIVLNEIIDNTLKMLQRLIGEDIELVWLPGADLWPVRIDPSQIDQILANLCINARDAIADVGSVTIETQNASFDEKDCAYRAGFFPGDYVSLAVNDDGAGIEPENLDKIFDPFFTTKQMGQGTGLGLATVYGIVKQNKGFINLYSEPGFGTSIKIYLPRHSGKAAGVPSRSITEIPRGHGESVLIVEDDPSILKLAARILEDLNFSVLCASTPGQAFNLAEAHRGQIRLLVTDVVMPEMNGRELAKQLQALYPDIKTVYMSGYTASVIAHRGVLEDGVCFISKPFLREEFAKKITEALYSGLIKH